MRWLPLRPCVATSPHRIVLPDFESPSVITFMLAVHTIIALLLVAFILVQKSEGGGLGIGGGTGGGLMSARGAANFLTRSTSVLAGLFIASSIILAVLAAATNRVRPIDTSLAKPSAPASAPLVPGALPGLPGAPAAPAPAGVPIAR